VTQGIGPEFKPQYCKKKKQQKKTPINSNAVHIHLSPVVPIMPLMVMFSLIQESTQDHMLQVVVISQFSFFCGLGLELRAYTLSYSNSPFL
jgi:SAM-dependent MidA family methyltransferase